MWALTCCRCRVRLNTLTILTGRGWGGEGEELSCCIWGISLPYGEVEELSSDQLFLDLNVYPTEDRGAPLLANFGSGEASSMSAAFSYPYEAQNNANKKNGKCFREVGWTGPYWILMPSGFICKDIDRHRQTILPLRSARTHLLHPAHQRATIR